MANLKLTIYKNILHLQICRSILNKIFKVFLSTQKIYKKKPIY